jgi:L-asparaginase II
MLAAAKLAGEPAATYLDPAHPVQRRNLRVLAAFAGRAEETIAVATDGCSAPTFALSLREIARAFARLVAAPSLRTDSEEVTEQAEVVAASMRAHPEMVAGEGMLDTILMRAVPGLVAKIGADGLHASGWIGPRGAVGAAVKVMDGDSGRARAAVVVEVLRQAGALDAHAAAPDPLRDQFIVRSLRGAAVGEVRPVFRLRRES